MRLSFATGALWSATILVGTASLGLLLPNAATVIRGAGFAVCTALAANKIWEASQKFGRADSGEVFRKALAHGVGAFIVIVVGSLLYFR